jgi:hypothetical protein
MPGVLSGRSVWRRLVALGQMCLPVGVWLGFMCIVLPGCCAGWAMCSGMAQTVTRKIL